MEVLNIGCSTKIKFIYRRALEREAHDLGVELNIIDLSQEDRLHWERIDGVLIPGGPDIDPCYYFNSVERDLREYTKKMDRFCHHTSRGRKRDAFEHGLLMEYFHTRTVRNVPVLGICRGMQMIAVSQGIPLYMDIKKELGINSATVRFDHIEVRDKDSLAYRLSEGESFKAAKLQHQAIRGDYFFDHQERWPNIRLPAFSHEGKLPEVIEFKDRPVLGVQFHPEVSFGKSMRNIFKWLLSEARERKKSISGYEYHYA